MKEEILNIIQNPILRALVQHADNNGVVDVEWEDGEMLRIRYDILIPADESDDGQEEAVVDVLESIEKGCRSATQLKPGHPGVIRTGDLPVRVRRPSTQTSSHITSLVRSQLRDGNVWYSRDFTDHHDGVRQAIRESRVSRGDFASAILDCMVSPELRVRTGAVAVLDEVAGELGPERITAVLRSAPGLFVGVQPVVPIAFPDLEWAAVASYQRLVTTGDRQSLDYFREIALQRSWNAWVFTALARLDGEWVVTHAHHVPYDHIAVLFHLTPEQRRRLISAKQPYPPEKPLVFGVDPWQQFSSAEAWALRSLMYPHK